VDVGVGSQRRHAPSGACHADTREAAMAAFAKSWRRAKAHLACEGRGRVMGFRPTYLASP
jgi:hypothetical protein